MTDDIFEARRKKLQAELIAAALALAEHTGAESFALPVPGTTPQVFVAVGAAGGIVGLVAGEPKESV